MEKGHFLPVSLVTTALTLDVTHKTNIKRLRKIEENIQSRDLRNPGSTQE